jgi:hypothetical protein
MGITKSVVFGCKYFPCATENEFVMYMSCWIERPDRNKQPFIRFDLRGRFEAALYPVAFRGTFVHAY